MQLSIEIFSLLAFVGVSSIGAADKIFAAAPDVFLTAVQIAAPSLSLQLLLNVFTSSSFSAHQCS
jgi:hypothetical protein